MIYDIKKTYLENFHEGPFFQGPYPEREWRNESEWIDFLGYRIASPIGAASGPLLNAKWIDFAARMGFDVVCYKTIRSYEHPAHGLPNIVPIRVEKGYAQILDREPENLLELGITNSFGNPSQARGYLQKDIPLANSCLKKGQLMIVSVFGSGENLFEDYAETARLAKLYGAKLIEANFSCPNVSESGGQLYHDPNLVKRCVKKIVTAIGDTPLLIKVGEFPDLTLMQNVLIAAAEGGARAVAGLNTLSMKVVPPLSKTRPTSGICGAPIRDAALDFVRKARAIIDEEKLALELVGVGGVMAPEHFRHLLDEGAKVAMSATGMMWDPYLAMKYHEEQKARI